MSKNTDLLQEITVMMTDPQQATNEDRIDAIMARIRKLKAEKTQEQLRLAACHFMTMYHTRKAMTMGGGPGGPGGQGPDAQAAPPTDAMNMEMVEEFKLAQRRDMELGWELLSIRGGHSPAARTARVLKIEVAQRLEDSAKLKEAFDDLVQRELTDEEVMVAFTAAPFLGDWKQMMSLGKRIERNPHGMEQLHLMSVQLPIPDFTLVYQLAKRYELAAKPSPPVESLAWDLKQVKSIRVRFKDVDCGEFEEKRKELMDEIRKAGDVEWEDVPNTGHVHIKRMGALCQAVSFGELPLMLNGPWLEGRISVMGRTEMPMMPEEPNPMGGMPDLSQVPMLVQEEEWDLVQCEKDPLVYRGTYLMKQRPELPRTQKKTPEHAPVNMTFECEFVLAGDETPEEPLVTEFDGLELD